MHRHLLVIGTVSLLLSSSIGNLSAGEDATRYWPQFRGPGGNSVATGRSIPLRFGPDEEVLWKTPLPTGHSSPCVWAGRVFVTGYEGTSLKMICLDAATGTVLWERKRQLSASPSYVHVAGSPANATPATDGSRVVFVFDDYGVVVTDMKGNELWEQKLPPRHNEYSCGASPVLDENRIYLNRDGKRDACLLCLDVTDGAELWKAPRSEALWGFSTPHLLGHEDRKLVLLGSSGRLTAYDARRGNVVWYVTGLPRFACPSPALAGNKVFYGGWTTAHAAGRVRVESAFDDDAGVPPEALKDAQTFLKLFDGDQDGRLTRREVPPGRLKDTFPFGDKNSDGYIDKAELESIYDEKPLAPGRNVLLAVSAGGRGDATDTHVSWELTKGLPYVASPLAYRGRIYLAAQHGFFSCIDQQSGQPHFLKKRLGIGGEYYASPVAVGDHIIVCAQRGPVLVVKASDELEVIWRTDLGESVFATPAVSEGVLFVRSEHHLWAFGKRP